MDFGEFFKQIPPVILFAPIVFGGLYVGMMAYILQRARARRRRAREAAEGIEPAPEKQKRSTGFSLPIGDFLRGELPNRPSKAADWTVPAELRDIPEPDLELLSAPMLFEQNSDEESNYVPDVMPVVAETGTVAAASADDYGGTVSAELDWLAAVTPEIVNQQAPQEAEMVSAQNEPQRNELSGDAVEVMRIYRDLSDGRLIIQMGDQRYRTLDEIKNPDLARRFTGLVKELVNIINNTTGRTQLVTGEMPSVPPPASSVGGMKSRIGLLTAEQEPPKRDFIQNFTRVAMAQTDVPQENTGIANAVEEFLQFKLATTPQFAARSIHIRASHDHGIRIEVDGHYFDSIGDVVDPDVRDFLRALMQEWEARH